MLTDARRDALPSYAMRASVGAALLGGLAIFFLLMGGSLLPPATKLLYASLPAIVGGALGTISAAKDRNETNLGLALAYAIAGVVFGPLILGVSVAIIDVVGWLLGMPAPSFADVGWKWWIGSMILASGLQSGSRLSDVASREPSKTSLRYVLCEFFGQAIGAFAIAVVFWICFEPEFPTGKQWLLAALAIGAGCAVMGVGSWIVRSVFGKKRRIGHKSAPRE
jgi:MFS family permease